ncbi:Uncharacterised protein [Mycobacteroides abscessus subsp. abscessus]|nr:Uncharacterised protein [Mycobacteroides abscessus subsp. abscessus]
MVPGSSTAVPDTSSRETRPDIRRRSIAMTAPNAPRSGSSPPTTLVPPPNGTTAMPCSSQSASRADTSSCEAG